MPSFRRLKKEPPSTGKAKIKTNSEETVLAECSNFQRRRSVVQRSPQDSSVSGKLQHERIEDGPKQPPVRTPTPVPALMQSSPPLTPSPLSKAGDQLPPRTFLDGEGGTPVSGSLNGSIARRRRQGEYFHRPPVWSILPIRGNVSIASGSDSESDSEPGVIPLNRSPDGLPVTTGIHDEVCRFCLRRAPEVTALPSLPAGENKGERVYGGKQGDGGKSDDKEEEQWNGNKSFGSEIKNHSNEPKAHWLKRFRSLNIRRRGISSSDPDEKPVGLRRRLRSTLRKRSESQSRSYTEPSDCTDAQKDVTECLMPVQPSVDSPKSG